MGHGVGDAEGCDEPDGEEFSDGEAEKGDNGEEGDFLGGIVTTGGEDEPAVEAVGGEVGGEEGSEVKVRQIFRTGVLGEVGAELIGEDGFTGVGYGEENENREDTANAVFSELNQKGRVATK